MQLELELHAAAQHIATLPGYQPGYEVLYWNGWTGYEESRYLAILDRDGQLYELWLGYCVMAPTQQDSFDPIPTTVDQALEDMLDMETTVELFERAHG